MKNILIFILAALAVSAQAQDMLAQAIIASGSRPSTGNTKLLLHFDGNLQDKSYYRHISSSTSGPISYDAIYKKFGSSIKGSDGLSVYYPANSTWNLGTTFTIECWIRVVSSTDQTGRCSFIIGATRSAPASFTIDYYISDETLVANYQNSSGTNYASSSYSYVIGDWAHCACVASNGSVSLYIEGILVGSTTDAVGFNESAYAMNVAITTNSVAQFDELRISNVARYTGSSFTVPTAPFTAD